MKCKNCKKEFESYMWADVVPEVLPEYMVLCDDCVIEAMKFKRDMIQADYLRLSDLINKIENR